MKKTFYILLCFGAIVLSGCKTDKRIDPTVMPAVTTTGEHTFGCLVDGWVTVGGRYYDEGSPIIYDDNHSIVFNYYASANYVDVRVKTKDMPNQYLKFRIKGVDKDAELPQKNCTFENAIFSDLQGSGGSETTIDSVGSVIITNLVLTDSLKIMSGTFSGKRMTEGRFDVRYRLK